MRESGCGYRGAWNAAVQPSRCLADCEIVAPIARFKRA